jgi:hypothetical protein
VLNGAADARVSAAPSLSPALIALSGLGFSGLLNGKAIGGPLRRDNCAAAIDEADRLQAKMLKFFHFRVQRIACGMLKKLYISEFTRNQFGTWIAMMLKY